MLRFLLGLHLFRFNCWVDHYLQYVNSVEHPELNSDQDGQNQMRKVAWEFQQAQQCVFCSQVARFAVRPQPKDEICILKMLKRTWVNILRNS